MAFGKIRRAGRYLARYREIFTVLVKYGLADWAHRIELDFAREIIARGASKELLDLSTQERVCRAMMELGPTFIKFGQALSLRPDIVGVPLAEELKKLQAEVTADPFSIVTKTIETELGGRAEKVFSKIEPTPVAVASIGQVHKAWLKTGEQVAVKIQRHGIEKIVETDIEILADLAGLLEDYVEEARLYRPRQTADRFATTIIREMDFNREARNIINLAEDLAGEDFVKIPRVYEGLTSSRLLVMEWMEGRPFGDIGKNGEGKEFLNDMAGKGASLFLKMIFVNGFYHADPHPGNLLIMDKGRLGLLDYGMMGRISGRIRERMEDMVACAIAGDSDKLARIIIKTGAAPQDIDEAALADDIADFIAYYGSAPLEKIRLFEALNEIISIIHRRHIVLPSEIILLARTLITLEGTGRILSPGFSLISLIEPYHDKISVSGLALGRRLSRMSRFYDDLYSFAETAPASLMDIIERFRSGALEIHMEHRGLEHSANRLVFGILTAALFIGSSMLLSFKAAPLVWGFSLLGAVGYVVSLLMGLRILWAIMIAGKLE